MRLFRSRRFAVAATALLAACGGDSTGPAGQLDPAATQAQIATIDAAFSNATVESFEGASSAIDQALGSSGAFASLYASPSTLRQPSRVQALAQRSRAMLGGDGVAEAGDRIAKALPTIVLGRTFSWNASLGRYALETSPPSGLPNVPANGVRFLLYTWDEELDRPATPLTQIGYADLVETTTGAGRTYRLVVTANSTVYLDYSTSFSFSQSAQRATFGVSGFVTNGTTRADFVLDNTVSADNNGEVVFDYDVRVPSENITLDYAIALRNLSEPFGDERIVVDLELAGSDGRVALEGTVTAATESVAEDASDDIFAGANGELTVRVNGGTFAVITLSGSAEPVVTDADGNPLSADEVEALEAVFELIDKGFEFIDALLSPVNSLFS